jgi:hypothetical protein
MYSGIGAIGIIPTFLTLKIKEQAAVRLVQDVSNPTAAERLATFKLCHDEFLGALSLVKPTRKSWGHSKMICPTNMVLEMIFTHNLPTNAALSSILAMMPSTHAQHALLLLQLQFLSSRMTRQC